MKEHPKVHVTISIDRAQAHGESTSVRAAIAETGAQVNVWSLDKFVKYGFPHDILTPASNLVAANHSSISIEGRSLPSLKDCRVTVMLCNVGPWSTLAPTFRPSFYRMARCQCWGSCPPVSHHWENMLMLRRRNALVNLLPSLMRTSRALSLVAAPHREIEIILALALNVPPCHHSHVRYLFAVLPKIMIE